MKVIDQTLLEKVIIERCRHSHKGDYGRLLLLGGTYPYGGAIIMSAIAAVKSGAGLVTVGDVYKRQLQCFLMIFACFNLSTWQEPSTIGSLN